MVSFQSDLVASCSSMHAFFVPTEERTTGISGRMKDKGATAGERVGIDPPDLEWKLDDHWPEERRSTNQKVKFFRTPVLLSLKSGATESPDSSRGDAGRFKLLKKRRLESSGHKPFAIRNRRISGARTWRLSKTWQIVC
jgi:hypothetical protein